jgi:hypothetical protein
MIADIARQRACRAQILDLVIDICFMIFAHFCLSCHTAVGHGQFNHSRLLLDKKLDSDDNNVGRLAWARANARRELLRGALERCFALLLVEERLAVRLDAGVADGLRELACGADFRNLVEILATFVVVLHVRLLIAFASTGFDAGTRCAEGERYDTQ